MLIILNSGAVKINLTRRRYRIIAKDLAGLWKLSFFIEYEDRLSELEFD